MTRREIFLAGTLICLGIFILFGIYLWKENNADSKEVELNKQTYTRQATELQNAEKNSTVPQTNQASTQPAGSATGSANTEKTPNTTSRSAQPATNSNSLFNTACKVGDVIKFGDVEMLVTQSTVRHKVIDITLDGNNSAQPPRLVLSQNNRIVYEIPADVDVNVDVTEKIEIEKSPLLNNINNKEEKKAGK